MSRNRKRRDVEESLIENLMSRGLTEELYRDKVAEYMDLWETRQQLEDDIRMRGITIEDPKRGMLVENRSVAMAVQVSKQMLNIYAALGFRGLAERAGAMGGEEDDEM